MPQTWDERNANARSFDDRLQGAHQAHENELAADAADADEVQARIKESELIAVRALFGSAETLDTTTKTGDTNTD